MKPLFASLAALWLDAAAFTQTTVTPAPTIVTVPPVTVTPPSVTATSPPLSVVVVAPTATVAGTVTITGGTVPVTIPIPVVTVTPPPPPPAAMVITGPLLGAIEASMYNDTLVLTGGTAPYTWTITGLPAGFTHTAGVVSGTPTVTGTFSVVVSVTDSESPAETVSATFSMVVATPTPPLSSITWVYHDGAMLWGGDWSYGGSVNYKDTSGGPIDGAYDILFTSTGYGGWQPYISGSCQSSISFCFTTTGFNYLIFSAKATQAKQTYKAAILSSGDTADGAQLLDLGAYCGGGDNPPVGVWEQCKVPLSAFGLTNPIILKFSIGTQFSGASTFYLDDIGFSP